MSESLVLTGEEKQAILAARKRTSPVLGYLVYSFLGGQLGKMLGDRLRAPENVTLTDLDGPNPIVELTLPGGVVERVVFRVSRQALGRELANMRGQHRNPLTGDPFPAKLEPGR